MDGIIYCRGNKIIEKFINKYDKYDKKHDFILKKMRFYTKKYLTKL